MELQNNSHNKNHGLNPFSPQHPAQPEYFADREKELQSFKEAAVNSAGLKVPSPKNFAILGTWGEGKTSLLYKFRHVVTEELQQEIHCTSIFISLSPEACKNWEVFTKEFLRSIRSSIVSTNRLSKRVREEVAKWELNLNVGVVSAKRAPSGEPVSLVNALQELWMKHLAPSGVQVAFVLMDDLHYFPLQREESAYLTLRTTFQELVNRKCNYSLVVTAPTLLFSTMAEIAEPVIRFFEPLNLGPFDARQAREVIEVRLRSVGSKVKVDEDAIESMVRKTRGHPYILVFAMHELMKRIGAQEVVTKQAFEKAWPEIELSLGRTIFEQRFLAASPAERKLLIEVAKTGEERVAPGKFKRIKGSFQLFSRLEEKELVIHHERGSYSLFHPLFAEYLRHQESSGD